MCDVLHIVADAIRSCRYIVWPDIRPAFIRATPVSMHGKSVDIFMLADSLDEVTRKQQTSRKAGL